MTAVIGRLPAADAEWARGRVWVPPFPPLQDILTALLCQHADVMNPLLRTSQQGFIDEVMSTVKYFVRRDPELEPAASRRAELYWLVGKLRLLLKLCLLRELGFSAEKSRSFFAGNAIYQHLVKGKGECIRVETPLSLEGRGGSSRSSWCIPTKSLCTVQSATLRPRTRWLAASGRCSPSGIASWMRRGNGGEPPARRVGPPYEPGGGGHCLSHLAALRCLMAWAEDRAPWRHDPSADPGTKTEGRRPDAALSFPSGLVRKRPIEAL